MSREDKFGVWDSFEDSLKAFKDDGPIVLTESILEAEGEEPFKELREAFAEVVDAIRRPA